MKEQFRITGRFRKDENRHVVDRDPKWSSRDAYRRLKELREQAEWEMKHKQRKAIQAGFLSVGEEYYSDYDLLDLRVESRQVSPWTELAR